ncbi:hypothetical protein AAL_06222 [Moelleriella libera RCEF 2490]|uniref:Uncharacterized protein n=1 Tax=Moelleriella libera RCEF 2490 TaxID=1081109 RepID=A0A167ZFK2_9HYPO|nr:hypothetical protein AAL_06222 [Moelleriella libera RCEF 2490]
MNIILLFAGLLAICPVLRLIFHFTRASRYVAVAFERFVRYPLILKGGSYMSVTRFELLLFVAFLVCNMFALAFLVTDVKELEQRAAILRAINMTPLFLSGEPESAYRSSGHSIASILARASLDRTGSDFRWLAASGADDREV